MIRLQMGPVKDDGFAEGLMAEMRRNAPRAVRAGRRVVVDEMKRLLQLRAGGPAPAGAPPAKVEGELLRSIKTPPVKRSGDRFTGEIDVDHPGAARLEFGKRDIRGIETAPHPFFLRSFASKRAEAEAAMEREL